MIHNKPQHECRYTMLPAESSRSEVTFEAVLKMEGPADEEIAFLSLSMHSVQDGRVGRGTVLAIGSNGIWPAGYRVPDLFCAVDLSDYHKITLHHRRGLLRVSVDDHVVLSRLVDWGFAVPVDFRGGDPSRRTQFGQLGDDGTSYWKQVRYAVKNPTFDDHTWKWSAESQRWPDDYQRRRMIQIHPNHPDQKPWPDHGYSSWVVLEDGRIMLVDYTNLGDQPHRSHLVGVYLETEDLR